MTATSKDVELALRLIAETGLRPTSYHYDAGKLTVTVVFPEYKK